jgi:hypothetical protein
VGSSTTTAGEVTLARGIGATVVPGSRVERTAATLDAAADAAAPAVARYRTVGALTGPSVPESSAVDRSACKPAASSDRTSEDASATSPTTAMVGAVGAVAAAVEAGRAAGTELDGPRTTAVPSAAEDAGCRNNSPALRAMTAAASVPVRSPQRRSAVVEKPGTGRISPEPRNGAPRAPAAG